jgi:periplasmic protein TonB
MEITMFERLVESSRHKQGRRVSRYMLVTSLFYILALFVFVALAVLGFNPILAYEGSFLAQVTLPPAPVDPGHRHRIQYGPVSPTVDIFREPTIIPETTLPQIDVRVIPYIPPDAVSHFLGGRRVSLIGSETADPEPPPPISTPSPTPKIEPAPEAKPDLNKVSEGVLQGSAIKKVRPAYPEIARRARVGGLVQVQVMISEDGRVMEAFILNGSPLLRGAALEAARQWIFAPTTLSKMPVKVQGVLTFNFTLE